MFIVTIFHIIYKYYFDVSGLPQNTQWKLKGELGLARFDNDFIIYK